MTEIKVFLSIIISFVIAMIIAPFVIKLMARLKANQPLLQYVELHKSKSGTPTMGGIIFILPAFVVTLIFARFEKLSLIAALTMAAYGLLGFLDDFIKVRLRQNLGLKAYQKIIGQAGIGIIVTLFCYYNRFIGSTINIPFTDIVIELGWWYIPFTFLIYIALTNAVNLTDGLDGLASSVSLVYIGAFIAIIFFALKDAEQSGSTLVAKEYSSLLYFAGSVFGGLLAFLWVNSYPASVFMGDTGSLALGGVCSTLAVFSKNPFIILILGIMYVVSCISVIIQVVYFKVSKGKRIFLMAPFHHHLQSKGISESKIVTFYTIITLIAALVSISAFLV